LFECKTPVLENLSCDKNGGSCSQNDKWTLLAGILTLSTASHRASLPANDVFRFSGLVLTGYVNEVTDRIVQAINIVVYFHIDRSVFFKTVIPRLSDDFALFVSVIKIAMPVRTSDVKEIDLLRDVPDLIPARWDNFENTKIRVIDREEQSCRNYLSANRRGFYKIVFINEGHGVFTVGMNNYDISRPTILFIHPNDIISWRNLTPGARNTGFFCFFTGNFIDEHAAFKNAVHKFGFFDKRSTGIISLPENRVTVISGFFRQMLEEQKTGEKNMEDALQAYLELIMISCNRADQHPVPEAVSTDYRHVHDFFLLLEKETARINLDQPVRIRTAKEFAEQLSVHPNYLNSVLKKQTGQNISAHIKNRLLEESKILLLRTDWVLQDIGYAIGFAEQPNFSHFFKKNTGITPAEFRKSYEA
jgi:AraC-like DNA-binding protein